MALILSKVLSTGVTANYWRVEKLAIDREPNSAMECVCHVGLYLNEQMYDAGYEKIEQLRFVWNGEDNPFNVLDNMTANPVIVAYGKLATLPEFAGAAYG